MIGPSLGRRLSAHERRRLGHGAQQHILTGAAIAIVRGTCVVVEQRRCDERHFGVVVAGVFFILRIAARRVHINVGR